MTGQRNSEHTRRESIFSSTVETITTVNKEVKIFGAMTLFTTLVVVCMSVYVVHTNEFRYAGRRLVNANNEDMSTATSTKSVALTYESLTADVLRDIKRINIKASDNQNYGFDVMAYDRDEEEGVVVLQGNNKDHMLVLYKDAESAKGYEYFHSDGRRLTGVTPTAERTLFQDGYAAGTSVSGLASRYTSYVGPWIQKGCSNPSTSNCMCVLPKYRSSSQGCMKYPNLNLPTSGSLSNTAFLGENCESKTCWNPSNNYLYKGNAQYQADFSGNDEYEYKLSMFESMSCRGTGRTTGWGWSKRTTWSYSCIPMLNDQYRNGERECRCSSWWDRTFGGSCSFNECGPGARCQSTSIGWRCR